MAQIPFLKSLGLPHRSPNRFSTHFSTHLSTLLSTYISSLRSSLTCHPTTNNWDGNYKFGIFGSCEIIFARLDFDFATASKMITFLRFLLPAYFFSAILQHQLHGKQNDGKDGNTCLLPHASQLRGERSSLQLLLLCIFSSSSTAGLTLRSATSTSSTSSTSHHGFISSGKALLQSASSID